MNSLSFKFLVLVFAITCSFCITKHLPAQDVHQADVAISQFEVHPDLDVGLFASEPMMANPSNIDVDHLGRVWVCEVINYRQFRNKDSKERVEGDRILILEDTDGDAKADKSTVFYQGRDIDSAHGICVLGDRAIVSANDSVFYLIDTDGDSKADKKELLFTGIGGTQHDHGIHAFVFGPDGKLYFNFGNHGNQIKDKHGNPVTDKSGRIVSTKTKPYKQGMVFRCNLDGSEFETLGWNFRNNWEVCVDSFGTLWQSDNDDDGNKATRINYVMPFGNYGYTDEVTGSGWRTSRTNMHPEIPVRHWYQNDPGVIPNLLITGAGSPTGICVYEGDALPNVFKNQVIHCDAGPSIVRSYPVQKDGAGYSATIVNMLDGAKKNQWFRPSDVCVAPDGSLIVADWYDPGVGGHRMGDIQRGRLFRLTAKGASSAYQVPKPDFSSPAGAAEALQSPNLATRYLAFKALEKFGTEAVPAVEKLWQSNNPRVQARALWLVANLNVDKSEKLKFIHSALGHENADLRVTGIRVCVHIQNEIELDDINDQIDVNDPAPEVLRAILIGLRQWPIDHLPQVWAPIADNYVSGDRWFLEALGIAAEGRWDECLDAWTEGNPAKLRSSAGRDLVWRSRGNKTPLLIRDVIVDKRTKAADVPRYFRALDICQSDKDTISKTLASLAFDEFEMDQEKTSFVKLEAASRIDQSNLTDEQKEKIDSLVSNSRGTPQFVTIVDKFSSEKHYEELLDLMKSGENRQSAADSARVLMSKGWVGKIHSAIVNADSPETRATLCDAIVNCGEQRGAKMLGTMAKRKELDSELRTYVVKRMGQMNPGATELLKWAQNQKEVDPVLIPAVKAALHSAQSRRIKEEAQKIFPIARSKDNKPVPPMSKLVKRKGNAANGAKVFADTGTCAKCHIVNGKGIEVGPDLSEIGSKLTKLAMYESILFPSAGISHNYENWKVLKDDGQMVIGILLGETATEIQIKDDKGISHTIPLDQIDEKKKQQQSLMPEDLHKEISEQDLVDIVEYMMTLKKK